MLRLLIRYNFKTYIGNRMNFIWNFIFPFAYIIILFMALYALTEGSSGLDTIRVSLVPANESISIERKTEELKSFLSFDGQEAVWKDGSLEHPSGSEKTMILYTQANETDSLGWLTDDKIDAMITVDEELSFKVKPGTSLSSTVLHEVLAAFEKVNLTQNTIMAGYQDGRFTPVDDTETADLEANRFAGIDKSNRRAAIYSQLIYFFSALAYVTYFPINSGIDAVESIEPGQSAHALRKAVAPVTKIRHFFGALIPRWAAHLLLIVLLFGFTRLLKIDYGTDYLRIILLLLFGTSSAVFTGTALGALLPAGQGVKTALSISVPLIFALASGMMASPLHSIIMKHVPWLHNWNPLGMITNGLYALYAGDDLTRYNQQLLGLGIFILLCLALTLIGIKRTRYESV